MFAARFISGRAAARTAYDKGKAAFDKGDYAAALKNFVKANAVISSLQAMFWIAQAQDKLGHTDAAIEAYEALGDYSQLGPEKANIVAERLAALKPPPPPPSAPPPAPAAPPVEPAPIAAPAPAAEPPATNPPPAPSVPPNDWAVAEPTSPLPKRHTFELGLMGGALFVADLNNVLERGHSHATFDQPVWQAGVRAAFFPENMFGIEAEWAHGFGTTKSTDAFQSSSANFDVVRGHLIGQLPASRFVPFVLLGAGFLHGSSKPTGSDGDFMLEGGLGAKFMATKLLVPRVDFRLNMTQKQGGGFTDGVALHPEILLGLSFTLGR